MSDHTKSVEDIFEFNSRMVRLGLDDLASDDASHRMRGGEGSSISFLAEHMLASRLSVLELLGRDVGHDGGATSLVAEGSGHADIAELRRVWNEVSEKLDSALRGLRHADVIAPHEGLPVPDQTVRGALMFRAWHESYHVGQLGLIRTELGYPALRTRLRAEIARTERVSP